MLHAIADGIEARAEDLAAGRDRGQRGAAPLASAQRDAAGRANFRFFADWLDQLDRGELEPAATASTCPGTRPGVTAIITPWNAPLMLATWRIAPALAAGNTVVLKPPEWAPLTASLLADITREAGLPDGVFNVVQGLGREAGAPLAAHPDLARVCFTGSVATGRMVAAAAGAQLTPVSLELGGKSPLLVFDDADLELAVRHAVGQYDNAGQVCLAGTRLLVHESLADRVHGPVRGRAWRYAARRPSGRGDRPRAEHHPPAPGAGRWFRPAGGGGGRAGGAWRRGVPGPRRAVLPADAAGRCAPGRRS